MKKEYSQKEVEELVREVEKKYEEILQGNLIKSYFRFRVRSHYNIFNKLKESWLDNFDEEGKIDGRGLVCIEEGIDTSNCRMDEFGSIYFLPCEAREMLDGEEIISRIFYYYCGKKKMDRSMLMKELLADYREQYKKAHELHSDGSPGRSCDAKPPKQV